MDTFVLLNPNIIHTYSHSINCFYKETATIGSMSIALGSKMLMQSSESICVLMSVKHMKHINSYVTMHCVSNH